MAEVVRQIISMDFSIPNISKTLDVSNIEPFNGSHFKRLEDRVLFLLEIAGVAFVLIEAKPEDNLEQYKPTRSHFNQVWEKVNKI